MCVCVCVCMFVKSYRCLSITKKAASSHKNNWLNFSGITDRSAVVSIVVVVVVVMMVVVVVVMVVERRGRVRRGEVGRSRT